MSNRQVVQTLWRQWTKGGFASDLGCSGTAQAFKMLLRAACSLTPWMRGDYGTNTEDAPGHQLWAFWVYFLDAALTELASDTLGMHAVPSEYSVLATQSLLDLPIDNVHYYDLSANCLFYYLFFVSLSLSADHKCKLFSITDVFCSLCQYTLSFNLSLFFTNVFLVTQKACVIVDLHHIIIIIVIFPQLSLSISGILKQNMIVFILLYYFILVWK